MDIKVSHETCFRKQLLRKLMDKTLDVAVINNLFDLNVLNDFEKDLQDFPKDLNLEDGYFFPLPYSSIRMDHGNKQDVFKAYKDSYINLSQVVSAPLNQISKRFIEIIEKEGDCKPLLVFDNIKLNPMGFRVLFSNKQGIDIHCENAFLNQLELKFKKQLFEKVDLENAISLFVTISAPDIGGGLTIFDKEWETVKINMNETSYEERHDSEGAMFVNRQLSKPKRYKHPCKTGEAIVFRAAQMWHGIEKIEGSKERISMGCFIAKGKDGAYYYWA